VGVEFTIRSHNARFFTALQGADRFAIADSADWLTFGALGTVLKSATLVEDFGTSVLLYLRGNFPPFSAAPGMGASPEAAVASDPSARKCPPLISKPRSRSVSRNERICAENGGRKGPGCASAIGNGRRVVYFNVELGKLIGGAKDQLYGRPTDLKGQISKAAY
jgi:hypothetical protein